MDGSRLARRLLDRDVARAILAATLPYRDHAALVFDRDARGQIMFETMDWGHPGRKAYWRRNQALIAQSVPLEAALVDDPVEVMFNGPVAAMRVLAEALRGDARDYAVSLTEYPLRDFSLIDITAAAATKGRALAWRAAQLGLAREHVMAVGDNYNDVEMLEFAGTPVVMANAHPDMKSRGWHLTGHHDEAGVARAIERFALRGA
jgi:hydroxymethylpyrimidine pyrophosphatase-like HAD family hydrolase